VLILAGLVKFAGRKRNHKILIASDDEEQTSMVLYSCLNYK